MSTEIVDRNIEAILFSGTESALADQIQKARADVAHQKKLRNREVAINFAAIPVLALLTEVLGGNPLYASLAITALPLINARRILKMYEIAEKLNKVKKKYTISQLETLARKTVE